MVSTDWKATELWQILVGRGDPAEETSHYVRSWLNDVQTILAKGDTAPPNFTLHDEDHSFRVAQRMVELTPAETLAKLSDFEIGLLLQSAYLHDIGMNPRRKIVIQIRDYLLSGSLGGLDEVEAELLQRWLDETHPGAQPPIDGLNEVDRLHHAEFLTAYFCRHRHNDWSENFINEKGPLKGNAPYPDWIQDLILLCKSHHYGLQQLVEDQFNLRIAGPGNKLVNLRYLAAMLRVADVLEFDPERTPSVIFTHRDIDPTSRIFWYKDHSIVLALNHHQQEILITARTRDAWGHRAVLETVDAVNFELQTCATINDQNGFLRGVQLEGADHYKWIWPRHMATDISPQRNSFVYIDGAFRPDPRRILTLLAGTRLYDSPYIALRELIQNSFDAVKEQIALELLHQVNARDPTTQAAHAHTHRVVLSLEGRDDGVWLVCSDSGVGMTRRVIERHLLVGGSRSRPEVLELERQCASKGFRLNRSGEFGIGVLSYFMIAEQLIVETKPSPDAYRDCEVHGWRFETEGIDSFGELRVSPRQQLGTTVALRIKPALLPEFEQRAGEYLEEALAKAPCPLEIRLGEWHKSHEPGWIKTPDKFTDKLISNLVDMSYFGKGLHSNEAKQARSERKRQELEVRSSTKAKIRFFGPKEGELPDGLGSYRIYLPYFALSGGPSLRYIHETADRRFSRMFHGDFLALSEVRDLSWRGFQIPLDEDEYELRVRSPVDEMGIKFPEAFLVQLDLSTHASISVDRQHLDLDGKFANTIATEITRMAIELFDAFVAEYGCSPYSSFSLDWMERLENSEKVISGAYWAVPASEEHSDEYEWRQLNFPIVMVIYARGRLARSVLAKHDIKDQAIPLRLYLGPRAELPFRLFQPSKLLLVNSGDIIYPALLYDDLKLVGPEGRVALPFPSEWDDVLAIIGEEISIENKNHLIYHKFSGEAWSRMNDIAPDFNQSEIALPQIDTEELAASWFLYYKAQHAEFWNALRDNHSDFFERLFELVQISSENGILIWHVETRILQRITRRGASVLTQPFSRKTKSAIKMPRDGSWWVGSESGR